MAKDIEQLSIRIDANAQNASQALNSLIKQIDDMSRALRGVDASKMIGDLKEISTVTKSIKTSSINKQLNGMATAMNNYQRASSKSALANNSMGNGFNKFSSVIGQATGGLSKINTKINSFITGARSASKETKNFAQTIGLLYARFFLLIRGVKSFTNAIKSSMDYVEVVNYFDSAFGEVAKKSKEDWEQAGYESAEAYYESFSKKAKETTGKMTGFLPNEKGLLSPTNSKSLGMNPQEVMQYQALFAQMSNSMGVASENSMILSDVLTKLGGDLASIRNEDFEKTWKNMASGMVGMTKTLYQYGANISVANMNMKLHELGIETTANKLSQADKVLLRTIILLESSQYAWGDLAKTLNTPARVYWHIA